MDTEDKEFSVQCMSGISQVTLAAGGASIGGISKVPDDKVGVVQKEDCQVLEPIRGNKTLEDLVLSTSRSLCILNTSEIDQNT